MNPGLSRSQAHGFRRALLGIVSMHDKKGATKIDDSHDSADVHKVRKYVLPSRRVFRLDFSLIGQI